MQKFFYTGSKTLVFGAFPAPEGRRKIFDQISSKISEEGGGGGGVWGQCFFLGGIYFWDFENFTKTIF